MYAGKITAFATTLGIFFLLCAPPSHASIKTAARSNQTPLNVAVMVKKPPFSFKTNGDYHGISVALWRTIAERLGLTYRFIPTSLSYNEAVWAVHQKQFDVLIGPVSVTHRRMKLVDYSRPYFLNKIGVAIKKKETPFIESFLSIFGKTLLLMLISLLAGIILFAHLFWLFERRKSPDINTRYVGGIIDSTWYMLVCFLRDVTHEPKTHSARFLLFIWLLLSVTFMTTIVAFVTSSLTYSISQQREAFRSYADLVDKPLLAERGSINMSIVRRLGGIALPADSITNALTLLDQDKAEGLVGDFYLIKDTLERLNVTDSIRLVNLILSHDEYAFVFPKDSPLVKPVDLMLTKVQDAGISGHVCQTHLGAQYAHSCEF